MHLLILLLAVAFLAHGQDVGFTEKALDIAQAALKPYAKHNCTSNHWAFDISTPSEWGALGDVDIFSHVGQHWGCYEAVKSAGLTASAKTTHIVAYAGAFTAPTMFALAVGTDGDANKVVTERKWEHFDFDIGAGFVGGTVESIIEVDTTGATVREIKFGDPKHSIFLNWFTENGPQSLDKHLRMLTIGVKANKTVVDENISELFASLVLGGNSDFEIDFTFITSTDYGQLETVPPVPISSLGVEFLVTIKGWQYKNPGNRLGIIVNTLQTAGEVIDTKDTKRIISGTDTDKFYDRSYWNFPNVYQNCELSKKKRATCDKENLEVTITNMAEFKDVGNLIMSTKAKGLIAAGKTGFYHKVKLLTMAAGKNKVVIDPGFGVGPYRYITNPSCDDGEQNGNESGIDCGGDCTACPQGCHGVPKVGCESCTDGMTNGGEEFTDCGGPCLQFGDHFKCTSCIDGIQNGDEQGIDCGGRCALLPPKGINKECNSTPTCQNGMKDDNEDGVDCGGPCKICTASNQVNSATSLYTAFALLATAIVNLF